MYVYIYIYIYIYMHTSLPGVVPARTEQRR